MEVGEENASSCSESEEQNEKQDGIEDERLSDGIEDERLSEGIEDESLSDGIEDERLSDGNEVSNTEEEDSEDESDSSEGNDDSTKTELRKEMSDVSFEDLEKLRNKLGTKVFNEAMFGTKSESKAKLKRALEKRANKNRPREMSSKARVPRLREVVHIKKKRRMDPRFEGLCGDFDEKTWKEDYSFLEDMRKGEVKNMARKLKTEHLEQQEKKKIKAVLKAEKNKERLEKEKSKKEERLRLEKEENIQRLKEGKKPYYVKKSTRKLLDLAEKYDDLKARGTLDKFLKKKRKKTAGKQRKKIFSKT